MAKNLIELKNVSKKYKMGDSEVCALNDISLEIKQGEFVAITGPSGSGKSTLMNIVGCLDIPSDGAVFLNGTNIASLSESQLSQLRGKMIGFVFQQFNLIQTLCALDNVKLPLEFLEEDDSQARKKALALLNLIGLGERAHHLPSQLSGGQMQRVAIARALAVEPEILLADEPTGNLDTKTGQFIMEMLKKINEEKKKTIILVTHDFNLAKFAKRTIHIKDGQIEKIEQTRGVRK